jgi:hypothetical protein
LLAGLHGDVVDAKERAMGTPIKLHKAPTKDDVLYVCGKMHDLYEVPIIFKLTAPEMKIIGAALEAFGVLDADDFLSRFSTYLFGRVYLPFIPGTTGVYGSELVSIVHEYGHAFQDARAGAGLEFELDYCNTAKRAVLEAECYALGACLAIRYPESFQPEEQQVAVAIRAFDTSYGWLPEAARLKFRSELSRRVVAYRKNQQPFNAHLRSVTNILDGRLLRARP